MAQKKAGGSSRNGRDSAGRRLGVKKFGGEVKDTTATRKLRRDIARGLTVLGEKNDGK